MVTLVAWAYLALLHGRFWRLGFPCAKAPAPSARREVVAVMPARNEAATISAAVESLRGIDVVVVDDNSSDGTGEIARCAGAMVVSAGPLPAGWTGKMWAMSRGVQSALVPAPDYILFTDADIVHSSAALQELVARADADGLDMSSYMVKLRCSSMAERLLIPAFVFFFFMLYPPEWIASGRRKTAGAAGGCILIRPEALARIGGLESIRGELIDDCALARAVKRSGGKIWLGMTDTTRSMRPYASFADVRHMIARTAFTQLRYSPWLLGATVCGMCFLYVLPVAGTVSGDPWSAAAWIAMALIYAPMLRFYGVPVAYAFALPAVALFYLVATIESAVRYWTGRGGSWKGRNQAAAAT